MISNILFICLSKYILIVINIESNDRKLWN